MQPNRVRDVQAECPPLSMTPANHIEYCMLVARKHGARVRALPEALIVHRDISDSAGVWKRYRSHKGSTSFGCNMGAASYRPLISNIGNSAA